MGPVCGAASEHGGVAPCDAVSLCRAVRGHGGGSAPPSEERKRWPNQLHANKLERRIAAARPNHGGMASLLGRKRVLPPFLAK